MRMISKRLVPEMNPSRIIMIILPDGRMLRTPAGEIRREFFIFMHQGVGALEHAVGAGIDPGIVYRAAHGGGYALPGGDQRRK